jgi:hypothetical protein
MMVILVFFVENLVCSGWYSTGPHLNLHLPFGWLQLHRYGDVWIIEHFNFPMLIVAILVSILLAWVFSKALQALRRPMT